MSEEIEIMIDLETALILTANYNETLSVSSFVSLSNEFKRLQKYLHDRQYELTRLTEPVIDATTTTS